MKRVVESYNHGCFKDRYQYKSPRPQIKRTYGAGDVRTGLGSNAIGAAIPITNILR